MNSCVYLDLSDDPGSLENPKLATDDCQTKKYFLCEVQLYEFIKGNSLISFKGLAELFGKQTRNGARMFICAWSHEE